MRSILSRTYFPLTRLLIPGCSSSNRFLADIDLCAGYAFVYLADDAQKKDFCHKLLLFHQAAHDDGCVEGRNVDLEGHVIQFLGNWAHPWIARRHRRMDEIRRPIRELDGRLA